LFLHASFVAEARLSLPQPPTQLLAHPAIIQPEYESLRSQHHALEGAASH
jgi:hypothetical protein